MPKKEAVAEDPAQQEANAEAIEAADTRSYGERALAALLNKDLSTLSKTDQPRYLATLSQSLGLNPLLKPFDLIPNRGGKLTLYANAGCSDQLADQRGLSRRVLYAGLLCPITTNDTGHMIFHVDKVLNEKVFITVWEVIEKDEGGELRITHDVGASWLGDATGDGFSVELMKTWTKGQHRTTQGHCGIGAPSVSELGSIVPAAWVEAETKPQQPDEPKVVSPPEPKAAAVPPQPAPPTPPRPPIPPPVPVKR